MSELDADRQQIERLTDVVRPPTFAKSGQAGFASTVMERITVDVLHSRFKAQGVSACEHIAVKCIICGTVQSMSSLVKAGCAADKAESYIGFSCEGRFSNAGPWPSDKNKTEKAKARRKARGCDWTLGGLFRLHHLEVINADGKPQPMFDIATADEAQELERLMAWREQMAAYP